ncbi:hypothetical protein FACS1894101_3320 [Betaproteobacteria bacterium]|nr:hypothetical protein FACS1894101_3320 [Betaproteobacteria bacterium]
MADFSLFGLRDILLVQLCFFILLSLDDHARFPNQPAGAPAGIWVKSRRILNRFWLIGVAVSVGLILSFSPLRQPVVTPLVCLGIFLACWIALTALRHFIRQARATQGNGSFIAAILKQPRHFWGMHIAHIGVAVFVAGVTVVGGYEEEKDVKMAPGDSVSVAGNTFRFLGVRQVKGPNYLAWQGDVELSKNDRFQRRLLPEKRIYHSSAMPMTEAAIDAGFLRDVYVSLGEPIDRAHPEAEWAVRVYYKPLVDWIWGGCILMALGGLIAMLDRRYRNRRRTPTQKAAS